MGVSIYGRKSAIACCLKGFCDADIEYAQGDSAENSQESSALEALGTLQSYKNAGK